MSYEMDAYTDDCYDGTVCLVNKLNIRDAEKLRQAEAAITFAKASLLEQNPIAGCFDFVHYKAVHRFLFEDILRGQGKYAQLTLPKRELYLFLQRKLKSWRPEYLSKSKKRIVFAIMQRTSIFGGLCSFIVIPICCIRFGKATAGVSGLF